MACYSQGYVQSIQKKKQARENTFAGVLRLQKHAQRGGLPRNTIPQHFFVRPTPLELGDRSIFVRDCPKLLKFSDFPS